MLLNDIQSDWCLRFTEVPISGLIASPLQRALHASPRRLLFERADSQESLDESSALVPYRRLITRHLTTAFGQ
jgi:hypothetical protein